MLVYFMYHTKRLLEIKIKVTLTKNNLEIIF